MQEFKTRLKVRYAETDQMGVVYYANYLVWMEVARTEWFEQVCGRTYADLERDGYFLPVLDVSCHYKVPVRYPQEVDVFLIPRIVKGLYLEFDYEIRTNSTLNAVGFTRHVFTDARGKVLRLPDWLVQKLTN